MTPRKAHNGARLEGQVFGRLTVRSEAGRTAHQKRLWLCQCECGGTNTVSTGSLRSQKIISCGCAMVDAITKHGMHKSSEYTIWGQMKDRCYRAGTSKYGRYGGRGIRVCDAWRESFAAFYRDMGPRPSKDYTLDRIDNDGDYGPDNCRWTTADVQYRNRRQTKWIEFNDERLCQKDWCRRYDLDEATFTARLKRGWSLDRALTTPALVQNRNSRALLKGA